MKRIAALTMVRNDDFFLRKWVEYYGAQLGKEHLYIYFDGLDQQIPSFCEGTRSECIPKVGTDVVSNDKGRVERMSRKAAELLSGGYDLVIGTDADEFLAPDPALGLSLPAFLSGLEIHGSVSGLGLDMGQKLGEEGDLSVDQPFLRQRHYAQLGTRYTKASVLAQPLQWGSGFHRVKGHNFHIAKDLYLFHFGYCDLRRIQDRFRDPDRLALGWERHLRKRSRTIQLVSHRKARDFARWTARARRLQNLCRPPYAWNKPGMLGLQIVVRIPDRFQEVV